MRLLGASAPTLLAKDRRERTERLVYRDPIGEHIKHGRVDYHDVSALCIASRGRAANPLGKVIVRPHRVAVAVRACAANFLLHTSSAPSRSPAARRSGGFEG